MGRHAESDRGTTRAGHVLQSRPGVPTRGATNAEEAALYTGVGNEVVRRGASHGDLHDITRTRHLCPLRNREVHKAVVARASGQPCGRSVLATLSLGHEHLDGAPHQLEVLRP